MKNTRLFKYVILTLFAFSINTVVAQTAKDTVYVFKKYTIKKDSLYEKVYINVDKDPVFKEGTNLSKYITENINFPKKLNQDSIRGNVMQVRYTISVEGKIENVSLVKRTEPQLDAEALGLLQSGLSFDPGYKNKKRVAVQSVLYLQFSNIKQPKVSKMFPGGNWLAEFPGGNKVLLLFISGNLKYPKSAISKKTEGRVILSFTVSKTGEVKDIKIKKSLSYDCDKEAIRVVGKIPKWNPAMENGEAVDMFYTLPVVFRLK